MTHPFFAGPWPRAFAHRGWHLGDLHAMENSLSAFRRAVAEGYRYVETDVHATADEVTVVHHDPTLDRTTDGRGTIRRLPWSTVRTALIGGVEPVCRLDELLEELPGSLVNIDVKVDSAVRPTLRVIRRMNVWDRVCLAAFDERRIRMLRRGGGPRLCTAMGRRSASMVWAGAHYGGWPLRHRVRGAAAQVPPRLGRFRIVDAAFLRLAHRWGREVHAWTVDAPEQMRTLLDLGVDGLVTDRPDILREVLRQRGQWSRVEHPAEPGEGSGWIR